MTKNADTLPATGLFKHCIYRSVKRLPYPYLPSYRILPYPYLADPLEGEGRARTVEVKRLLVRQLVDHVHNLN